MNRDELANLLRRAYESGQNGDYFYPEFEAGNFMKIQPAPAGGVTEEMRVALKNAVVDWRKAAEIRRK